MKQTPQLSLSAIQMAARRKILANLAMLATVLIWGGSYISIKVVVAEVPPITMAAVRFLLASLLLYLLLRRIEPGARLARRDLPRIALAGLMGVTLYFCFENSGVKLTTASNASIIAALVPILSVLLDMIVFRSRPRPLHFIGIGLALAGTWLAVTANGQIDFSSGVLAGNFLMVAAMVAWTFYTLLSKSLQARYSSLAMITWQTMAGTAFLVPAALIDIGQWHSISWVSAANILFLAVLCSALCYLLYAFALRELDVTITTVYLNLVPVVGVVAGAIILRESILPIQMLGGLVIIAGIAVVNAPRFGALLRRRSDNEPAKLE